jgi:HCOMODA/2-hydroxy-3-carboxy-muconic semialdehyde decarboxylase
MTVSELVADLVTANAILFREGVFDTFGHVSARRTEGDDGYFMARSVPAPLVKSEDILEHDLNSAALRCDAPALYLERFIHGEIYRSRADVGAVIHSHAPAVLPFTVVRDFSLQAACHTSGFLGAGAPIFDIRSVAGSASDLLIRNNSQAAALAKTLGRAQVVLMRGHGFTIVGRTLRECVYNAIYAVVNARVVLDASRLGEITYLNPEEATATSRTHGSSVDRSWQVWKMRAAGELP